MANIANVRMGVCSLNFNSVDVGHTLGGTKVTITRKLTPLKVDKYGDSPVDQVLTDVELKVSTKVAEPVVTLIRQALPESTFTTGANGQQVGVGAGEGLSMRNTPGGAAQLVLHPLSKAANDTTEDVTVYLAVPTASPELNYDVAGQRVYNLEFDALVSEQFSAGRRLAHIGPTNVS